MKGSQCFLQIIVISFTWMHMLELHRSIKKYVEEGRKEYPYVVFKEVSMYCDKEILEESFEDHVQEVAPHHPH